MHYPHTLFFLWIINSYRHIYWETHWKIVKSCQNSKFYMHEKIFSSWPVQASDILTNEAIHFFQIFIQQSKQLNFTKTTQYHTHTREIQVKDSVYLWAETGKYVVTNTPKLWTGFKKCLPFARKKSWSVTIVTSQNVSHVFDPWDFFIFVVPYHYWNVNTDTCECVTICNKNEKPFICI